MQKNVSHLRSYKVPRSRHMAYVILKLKDPKTLESESQSEAGIDQCFTSIPMNLFRFHMLV